MLVIVVLDVKVLRATVLLLELYVLRDIIGRSICHQFVDEGSSLTLVQ